MATHLSSLSSFFHLPSFFLIISPTFTSSLVAQVTTHSDILEAQIAYNDGLPSHKPGQGRSVYAASSLQSSSMTSPLVFPLWWCWNFKW